MCEPDDKQAGEATHQRFDEREDASDELPNGGELFDVR